MSYLNLSSGSFAAVTPSDSDLLTYVGSPTKTRAIFVGGAGNIALKNSNGDTVTLTGVAAGSVIPVMTDKILATGTTATDIAALF